LSVFFVPFLTTHPQLYHAPNHSAADDATKVTHKVFFDINVADKVRFPLPTENGTQAIRMLIILPCFFPFSCVTKGTQEPASGS